MDCDQCDISLKMADRAAAIRRYKQCSKCVGSYLLTSMESRED